MTLLGDDQWGGNAPTAEAVKNVGGAPAFFSAHNIHAYYGESYIVQGVSFDVREGEILALLGRNGAGKTSTLRAIARAGDPVLKQGEIWLDHKPLHEMANWEAARAGLQLVPEDRRIIAGLTVEENLKLAQIAPPHGWSIERIYELFPRLGERKNQEGTTMSGGEQQMLAIGRALMTNPTLLILDEATEGLAPLIRAEIWACLQRIKDEGISILVIDKNIRDLLKLATRHYILERGQVVWQGSGPELTASPDVQVRFLGV